MRALAVAERMGIPSVAIAATGFMALASATARMEGIPDAAIAEYPGLVSQDSPDVFRTKVRAHVVPAVVAGLRQGNRHAARASAESKSEPADRIVFEGDLGDYERQVLDGGASASGTREPQSWSRRSARRLAAERRRELEPLRRAARRAEEKMTRLTEEREALDRVLAQPSGPRDNGPTLTAALKRRAELMRLIERAEIEWLAAEESLEGGAR